MPPKPAKKLKLMLASTVYNFQTDLTQICASLTGLGYDVWNSHHGKFPVDPKKSNLDNCVAAVHDCDVFIGIIRPFYGSGKIGETSITHEEFREAVRLNKPRWLLVHRDVVFARQLLKPYLVRKNGTRTAFKLKKNPVMDDLRVFDIYDLAIQASVPAAKRTGNWVQEFHDFSTAMNYLEAQLADTAKVSLICKEMSK